MIIPTRADDIITGIIRDDFTKKNRGNIINVMMIIPTRADDTITGIIRADITKKIEETLLMS